MTRVLAVPARNVGKSGHARSWHGSASGRGLRFAVSTLRAEGYAVHEILRRARLDPAHLEDPDARVPHAAVLRFWEEATRATGEASLGLRLGSMVRPAAFDALGYVFRISACLGDGMRRLAQYYRFLDDALRLAVEADDRECRIVVITPARALLPRPVAEFLLAAMTLSIRMATRDEGVHPSQVEFTFGRPASLEGYQRYFRAPTRFARAANALVFPVGMLERPFPGAEPELREVLERRVRDVIARLPRVDSLADGARGVLGQRLPEGRPTAADVARRLAVSERTLRRRLRAEGTSLRALLENVRRTLADQHMRAGVSLTETAFLLGYADVSAFHRSFKTWTGQTPTAYRSGSGPRSGKGRGDADL